MSRSLLRFPTDTVADLPLWSNKRHKGIERFKDRPIDVLVSDCRLKRMRFIRVSALETDICRRRVNLVLAGGVCLR